MAYTRESAWQVLFEYTENENLRRHALAVEAAMRAYARKFGEDEEPWGIVGLLHDFDYERYPDLANHPFRGAEILRERGWPESIIRAILSHGDHTGVSRQSRMEKTLFACDELTGLIAAAALVRPDKSLENLEVASIKKRMKEKAFAKGVRREDIVRGAEELGVDLDEHITVVLDAMRGIAAPLGLAGPTA
ncbi:MAG: HDIG domain-containing metalloprotein [Candidatus Methylomirabilales bacterium]